MEIKLTPGTAKPGARLKLEVSSSPNSYVALLGVDKSVTLLGSGNDIDKSRVVSDMNGYNAYENFGELKITGNDDRYLDFGESNAFILTNALEGEKSCLIDARVEGEEYNSNEEGEDIEETGDQHNPNNPYKRKNFPETWIFYDFELDNSGKKILNEKVPDTITSFVVSGFAVNKETGLGVAIQKKVTVTQEFFLNLFLPYSIRFGEVLKVDVTVFNYISKGKKTVQATVKMLASEDYQFVTATASGGVCNVKDIEGGDQSKTISVPYGNGAATYFLIRALITGRIKLKVKASTGTLGDQVEKYMLVEHEGLTHSENKPFLIDLRKKNVETLSFDLPIMPEKLVWKSIKIEASANSDLLGPALANVHSLM